MTDCPKCHAAAQRLSHGEYLDDCLCCQARRIAYSFACAEARRQGVITPEYKAELCAVAGEWHWEVVHQLVCAWQRGELPTIVHVRTAWSSR